MKTIIKLVVLAAVLTILQSTCNAQPMYFGIGTGFSAKKTPVMSIEVGYSKTFVVQSSVRFHLDRVNAALFNIETGYRHYANDVSGVQLLAGYTYTFLSADKPEGNYGSPCSTVSYFWPIKTGEGVASVSFSRGHTILTISIHAFLK